VYKIVKTFLHKYVKMPLKFSRTSSKHLTEFQQFAIFKVKQQEKEEKNRDGFTNYVKRYG